MLIVHPHSRWFASIICVAALAVGPPQRAGAQTPIRPGGHYPGGTGVTAEAAGVGFEIPGGMEARMDPETGLFSITGAGIQGAAWAFSSGTAGELLNVVGRQLTELGLLLAEDAVTRSGVMIRGTWDVWTDAGQHRLVGAIHEGPNGAVAGFAAMGGRGDEAALTKVVEDLVASLSWPAAEAQGWAEQMGGLTLISGSAHSDFSPDIHTDTPLSQAGREDVEITLCRDGTYSFESESSFIVNTPDVSVGSEDQDAHAGAWSVIGDVAGTAHLLLEPLDREELVYEVAETAEGLLVGELFYDVQPAPC